MLKNQVRIIGGKWRSRKIDFPATLELRPSPDRVRETLFNWLAPKIIGSTCLDLFAGSGALGFEALSRGAFWVIFVDTSDAVIKKLRETQQKLQAKSAEILHDSAEHFLQHTTQAFDIIFLDPPFQKQRIPTCLELIRSKKLLKANGYLYIEQSIDETSWTQPNEASIWSVLKEKRVGQVLFQLVQQN